MSSPTLTRRNENENFIHIFYFKNSWFLTWTYVKGGSLFFGSSTKLICEGLTFNSTLVSTSDGAERFDRAK